MKDFAGKIAVITGGGTGMGRELARQLVAEGCNVAMCDVSMEAMAETKRLCEVERLPQGLRITTHIADVSDETQMQRFRDEIAEQQATDKIHLLFNNAGIGGGGSLFTNTREQWERTFNICWGGVYLGVRTFLPMMLKADEGHIVNTSSVNGFWASVGMLQSHTAYSAAKFAVKGFSEALINDLRLNAPHIKCSVVMPGHIGTSILSNSRKIQSGTDSDALNAGRDRVDAQAARDRAQYGYLEDVRRGCAGLCHRARPQLSRGSADLVGASRDDHSRRRQGGTLAHFGGRRCAETRCESARRAGAGLRSRILSELCSRGRLEVGVRPYPEERRLAASGRMMRISCMVRDGASSASSP